MNNRVGAKPTLLFYPIDITKADACASAFVLSEFV